MPPEPIQSLLLTAVISVPLLALAWAIEARRFPFLGLRRPPSPSEPPLWGWAEILLVLCLWYLLQQLVFIPLYLLSGQRQAVAFAWTQVFVAGALAYVLRVGVLGRLGQSWQTLGLRGTTWRNAVTALVVGLLALLPLGVLHASWRLLLSVVLGREPAPQDLVSLYAEYVANADWVSVGHLIAAGTLVAAVVEEVIFRGFVFGAARLRWGAGLAMVVSSVLFAMAHFSLSAFPALFAFGCLLCHFYERTGSLVGPMLFHGTFNALQFSSIFFDSGGG